MTMRWDLAVGMGFALLAASPPAFAQTAGLTLCNRTGERIYDLFVDNAGRQAVSLGLSGIEPGVCAAAPGLAPGAYDLHFASNHGGLCVLKITVSGAAKIDIGPAVGACVR
jgi:hypothetical protein